MLCSKHLHLKLRIAKFQFICSHPQTQDKRQVAVHVKLDQYASRKSMSYRAHSVGYRILKCSHEIVGS
jgi:hypothetical protein